MPQELNPIEEIDILIEIQNPLFVYSIDSFDEQIALTRYINSLFSQRILLLGRDLFNIPYIAAGLNKDHVESIIKDSGYDLKKIIFSNFSNPEFLNEVQKIISELDNRGRTTENSTRLKNILQYLKDNKSII